MDKFLEILSRIGGENAPTRDELAAAKDGIARELHALKRSGTADLAALTAVVDAYKVAERAVAEADQAAAAAAAELEASLADVPDPDAADEAEEEAEEPVTASVLPLSEAVRRLGLTPPAPAAAAAAAAPVDPAAQLAATRTTFSVNGRPTEPPSWNDLAKAFVSAASTSRRIGKERVFGATTEFAADRTLTGRIGSDTSVVDSFMSLEAINASGGCCSLPEPIRDNPVLGSTARPIRDSLNTLGARAGQFTFYPSVCDVDGVALWTCEQDAAVDPEDPDTWKACATSECDDAQVVTVEAIYACRTVGNFKAKFAPEQWRAELEKLAIQQARVAEVALFTKMRAATTASYTLNDTGSVYLTLLQGLSRAAAAIRQDQRLGNAQLDVWATEWVQNAIWSDLVGRRFMNTDDIAVTTAAVEQAAARIGVNIHWSQDIDPINGESPAAGGTLGDFPGTAHLVFAPNGYYTFLDGGQLDVGTEIRDVDLTRQNSFGVFSESFEGLLPRGCDAYALDLPVTVCDNAPCAS